MFVRCAHCPHCVPSWQYCYVFMTGTYEWVKVFRCYPYGARFDKEAEAAEGYQAVSSLNGESQAGEALTTSFSVHLPENATLKVDNHAVSQGGSERRLVTPPLRAGEAYLYTLTAEVERDGRRLAETKRIEFRPGETKVVRFDFSSAETAAK